MSVDVLHGLNPAQRDAVETTGGPLLIVAGPGSGKTRVITHRIAYLVQECNVDPYGIAAVTFTNKAAREMRDRLDALLGHRSNLLTCGTFHAFCAAILRRDGHYLGLDRGFVIYDDGDQINRLKRAMEEANIDPNKYPVRGMQSSISRAKSNLLDPAGFALVVNTYYEEIVLRVYERYQSLLTDSRAVDFDDLLMRSVDLLQRFPVVLEVYRSRYVHLLIDEFQDTNIAQYALAKLLTAKHRNICVVGDPDQSIYSWRNADIRNILSFQRDYPESKVINLEENYRSTQTILDTARHLINPNKDRLQKELWTKNEKGHLVVLREAYTPAEEARMVLREIDSLVSQGKFALGDFAVMYRVNAQSRALEDECIRLGVPYRLIGGVKFYQRREIKDIVAYMRVLANPWDEVSLIRIINLPPRGIGARTIEETLRWARARGLSLFQALHKIVSTDLDREIDKPSISTRSIAAIERFLDLLNTLMIDLGKKKVGELIESVLEQIGYRGYLEEGDDRSDEKLANISELVDQANEIQDIEGLSVEEGLSAFVEKVALVSDIDNLPDDRDSLTLITLHQAKGLEFPVVFIVGMEEGLLPHARSMDDPQEIEEERRLFYVGVTRSQERLYLSTAFTRPGRAGLKWAYIDSRRSKFLDDIPNYLIASSQPKGLSSSKIERDTLVETTQPLIPLQPGNKVIHKHFGLGIVVSCVVSRADHSDHEVVVAFGPTFGIKRLLLSSAPMEKISGDKE